jgi:RING finger protein 170
MTRGGTQMQTADPMAAEGFSTEVAILALVVLACVAVIALSYARRLWRGGWAAVAGAPGPHAAGGGVAQRHTNTDCPVCLEPIREDTGVTTLCDHSYCAPCWVRLAQREQARTARYVVRCAYCRQEVTLLQRFSPLAGDAARAVVVAYNARAAARGSWLRYVRDTPLLLRRLWRDARARPWAVFVALVRAKRILWCVGMLIYIVSPFDLIPEAVFGLLGIVDDVIVLFFLLVLLGVAYRGVLHVRERRRNE